MKRVLKSTAAVLMAAFLPVAGVFASSGNPLDYANSIGQVRESDTVNRVVEATADGGYVVGGQIIVCEKRPIIEDPYYGDINGSVMGDNDEGGDSSGEESEFVPAKECLDYYGSDFSISSDSGNLSDFSLLCEMGGVKDGSISSTEPEREYYYNISCANYIAKFKKDGTREWLTSFENDDKLLAVGETSNDYRLLTSKGIILIADKNGTEKEPIESGINSNIVSAKIDRDGTIFVSYFFLGICKFGLDGKAIACIPEDDSSSKTYYSDEESGYFLMNGEVIANYYDSKTSRTGVVKITKDLKTVTTVIESPEDNPNIYYSVVSNDADGNLLVVRSTFEDADDDESDLALLSIDKNGEIVAEKKLTEEQKKKLVDDVNILPGFAAFDRVNNKLIKLDMNLDETFSYQFGDDELVFSSTFLDDGSVVAVGGSTTSNENYDIDGSMNGIQIRLDVSGSGDPEPVDVADMVDNPKTLDEMSAFMMIGGAVIAIAGVAARKMLVRR
ncbi:hypothetical protein IJM16_01600 [Candidatus Saccharibacteria bacterium]|nr:hypothetical protein [Candidatus Saccharibacteria bacterium]